MEWKSYHIFINNYDVIDEFIRKDFRKIIEYINLKTKEWFFIRYWQGGPHIRLRVHLEKDDHMEIKRFIEKILVNYNDRKYIVFDESRDNKLADFEKEKTVQWYPNLSVQDIQYMPENERYGGENVMSLSEDIFISSSKFCLNIIERTTYNKRIIIAFDIMYLTFKKIFNDKAFENIEIYRSIWKKYANEKLEKSYEKVYFEVLSKRFSKLNNNLDEYLKIYSSYLDVLDTKFEEIVRRQTSYQKGYEAGCLFSHIHMNNNRMGIFPELEYFLSDMIIKIGRDKDAGMVEF